MVALKRHEEEEDKRRKKINHKIYTSINCNVHVRTVFEEKVDSNLVQFLKNQLL